MTYIYVSVYIPPPGSKVLIDKHFDFLEEIEKGIEKFKRLGDTFIIGVFNSRTAQLSHVLLFDKYLDAAVAATAAAADDDDDDVTNISYENVIMRRNKDHVIDNNGKKLIALKQLTT